MSVHTHIMSLAARLKHDGDVMMSIFLQRETVEVIFCDDRLPIGKACVHSRTMFFRRRDKLAPTVLMSQFKDSAVREAPGNPKIIRSVRLRPAGRVVASLYL
jgi:hypothetical protein